MVPTFCPIGPQKVDPTILTFGLTKNDLAEAQNYWSWAHYLTWAAKRMGKIPLIINLDESPMPLVYDNALGNVVRKRPHFLSAPDRQPRRNVTRQDTRVHYTYVAAVCNIPWIQNLLPQVLIVPERCMGHAEHSQLLSELPHTVYVLRRRSMWSNQTIHGQILRLLRKILKTRQIQKRHKVIMHLDTFGGHTTQSSLQKMKSYGYWFCLIPAQMTCMLQPLDVDVFVKIKRIVRSRYVAASDTVNLSSNALKATRALLHAIMCTLVDTDYSSTFRRLGLDDEEGPTSATILSELEWNAFPAVQRRAPTQALVQTLTPRRRRINMELLRGCLPPIFYGPGF